MSQTKLMSKFKTKLRCPKLASGDVQWAFVILPKDQSEKLPRRGRTTVEGTINGHSFQSTLEPDGQLSHWLRIDKELLEKIDADIGESVMFEIMPVEKEPEPIVPPELQKALAATTEAQLVWEDTTTIARLDWIHWITSAKQSKTRVKRISDACDMLASGKRRVCCFDQSGFYSKSLSAPKEAD